MEGSRASALACAAAAVVDADARVIDSLYLTSAMSAQRSMERQNHLQHGVYRKCSFVQTLCVFAQVG